MLSCRSNPGVQVPATVDPNAGKVAAKLIPDPAAPSVELGKDEQFVPPQIMPGNPLPEYPPALIHLSLPAQTIAVRFYANEKSKVDLVVDSPVAASTPGPHCAEFEQSVRQALRQWVVYPARIRKFRPGPDGDGDGKPDYNIMTAQTTLRSFFDISFIFQVVDGKGVVRSAQ